MNKSRIMQKKRGFGKEGEEIDGRKTEAVELSSSEEGRWRQGESKG